MPGDFHCLLCLLMFNLWTEFPHLWKRDVPPPSGSREGQMRCGYKVLSTVPGTLLMLNKSGYYDGERGGWAARCGIRNSKDAVRNDGSLRWGGETATDVKDTWGGRIGRAGGWWCAVVREESQQLLGCCWPGAWGSLHWDGYGGSRGQCPRSERPYNTKT